MTEISRRAFARSAIVATAAAALPVATPAAETQTANPEVEARIEWIFTKYGPHLDDRQRADIRRIVSGGQAGIDEMRKYALENAAGPAEPFRPYRKSGSAGLRQAFRKGRRDSGTTRE